MRILETIRQRLERLLRGKQEDELDNRRRSDQAYAPKDQQKFERAAEQDARESADYNEQIRDLPPDEKGSP